MYQASLHCSITYIVNRLKKLYRFIVPEIIADTVVCGYNKTVHYNEAGKGSLWSAII
jgi:hypothetical protein